MNKESTDKSINNALAHKAKTALTQQVQSLDSDTRHRLRLARETALSKNTQSPLNLKWFTGAGAGLVLAGFLTVMIAPSLMSSSSDFLPLDELERISAEGDMDLVTQLDFYQWIDESSLSE